MYVCMYTIFKILQITSIEQLLLLIIIIMTIINFFLKYKKESINQSINQSIQAFHKWIFQCVDVIQIEN